MEKSMSAAVEPGQRLNPSIAFTAACGFALYWGCFFTMLMRNTFMDVAVQELWYHLYLRIVFLAGSAITCIAIALKTDWFASEKGLRLQKAGVIAFSAVAAFSSLTAYTLNTALPLAFDCIAWSLAGMGLGCLLMVWIELLSALTTKMRALALIGSLAVGVVAYLAINLLPYPFNIGMLCLCPLASIGIATLLERDTNVIAPAFVSLDESRKHARLSRFFKGASVAYGTVFGLGIGSTTQFGGSNLLLFGIAIMLTAGAGAAFLALTLFRDHIRQGNAFRFLFPVLIIALIPMSFFQGLAGLLCNLLIMGCYVFLESLGIELALDLAERKNASAVHLVSSSQACLYAGLVVGHGVGLIATSSGVMDYSMLSKIALGLVVLLAIANTFAPVVPLADAPDKKNLGSEDAAEEIKREGSWKARCKKTAANAGLSARETEVFMLLAKGRGIEYIQNKLCISSHTVKSHVYNIYRKMGINSREELLDAVEREDAL